MTEENKITATKVVKTEDEWRSELDDITYQITRQKGTERPFTGKFLDHDETGDYICVCCGAKLFKSNQKFDSHCGWPSFDESLAGAIEYSSDNSFGMVRTEITCTQCDSHLGHIFDDGPTATGKRYCVNSVSLDFIKHTE